MFSFRQISIVLLATLLLLRSAAGLTMQIDMAYTLLQTKASAAQAVPSCHAALQGVADQAMNELSNAAMVDNTQIDSTAASTDSESSACTLCCVAAAIPSHFHFVQISTQHTAPLAALFASLPAPAQRPTKPPLV